MAFLHFTRARDTDRLKHKYRKCQPVPVANFEDIIFLPVTTNHLFIYAETAGKSYHSLVEISNNSNCHAIEK